MISSKEVSESRKKSLKKSIILFGEVKDINIKHINWSKIKYQRYTPTYKMLINICYIIIQKMLLSNDSKEVKFPQYFDEQYIYKLYEKFVLAYYSCHYPMLYPSASYIDWNTDDDMILLLPRMKSDIILKYNSKTLIIDTKYYNRIMQNYKPYNSYTIHSNNLYQIFTYVKNKDINQTGNVSGMLLYAKTDETIIPNNTYKLSGNSVTVKTLDLNVSFDLIKKQLDDIIENWLNIKIQKYI